MKDVPRSSPARLNPSAFSLKGLKESPLGSSSSQFQLTLQELLIMFIDGATMIKMKKGFQLIVYKHELSSRLDGYLSVLDVKSKPATKPAKFNCITQFQASSIVCSHSMLLTR